MTFQQKELGTIDILYSYQEAHAHARLVLTFAEGDSYLCSLDTAYDSENFEEQESGLAEEDFFEMLYKIEKVIVPGINGEPFYFGDKLVQREFLCINYRHFPSLITTETGEQIYPPSIGQQAVQKSD